MSARAADSALPRLPGASAVRRLVAGVASTGAALTALAVVLVAIGATLGPGSVRAAESVLAFEDPADEVRYTELLEEYRCLKCQNQSLADSRASLALDLRREIYERVIAGEPKAAIDDYLVARYGDFVLYRPRFNAATAVLWIGPFVLLAIALGGALLFARRSGRDADAEPPTGNALAEARRLLDEPNER